MDGDTLWVLWKQRNNIKKFFSSCSFHLPLEPHKKNCDSVTYSKNNLTFVRGAPFANSKIEFSFKEFIPCNQEIARKNNYKQNSIHKLSKFMNSEIYLQEKYRWKSKFHIGN